MVFPCLFPTPGPQESLRKLDLSSTAVRGDIQVIGYPMVVGQLSEIHLDHTGVFGDIAVPGTEGYGLWMWYLDI